MSIFENKTGIKLWANKPVDITALKCPHCEQELPANKNVENFLNYLHTKLSTRYGIEKGKIVWDGTTTLEKIEETEVEPNDFIMSEFSPLPIFLTHEFDYKTHPEYRKKGLYLIAFIRALYEMPDTLRYVEQLKELFESVEWYTEYLYKHYEEGYNFWYEMVDQKGKEIIPIQEIYFAYL